MSYGEYHLQRATITSPGVPGESEPYALLADEGRVMPMGWNLGESFPVGQTGIAKYVATSRAGLWHFTPDAPELEREAHDVCYSVGSVKRPGRQHDER